MGYNNIIIFEELENKYSSEISKKDIPTKMNMLWGKFKKRPQTSSNFGISLSDTKIITFNRDAPSFLITGCQGAGSIFGDQAGVAKAMRKFMFNQDKNNTFGMLLGDNFYNSGIKNETDPLFENHFYQMYQGLDLPFFNILGNHDYDFHGKSSKSVHPMQRAMAQVNHTYVAKASTGFPDWMMPARYYALSFNNANFFMLDSNTFCFDTMQRLWLETTHKALNPEGSKKWNILVMHHPLVSYGKRHPETKKSDIDWYCLNEYNLANSNELTEKLIMATTMNQFIFEKLSALKLSFDLQLCAHDHFLGFSKIEGEPYGHYLNQPKITLMHQALVGGGGAFPHGLKNKDAAIWTEENYGFLNLKISEKLELDFHHFGRFWGGMNQAKFEIKRS